ncbi:P-loop containing nucleoside triphosphate hydrolase protein [Neohortaea acidophila]|uniref:Kinesin-like protein n=1 Tax=Neohortaea acidophila TaxID=245834 RepID=A0A6A6PJH3_9PEZI|nr:P-loop containing nucleoside triphosphate hydrolase protein [Neohortaea acidophila]KAF2480200.1 P-loop containing nucleoside triphosphate hydrolase protein [Neohortaea acidophila]
MSSSNTIKVVARFRPQNHIEQAAGSGSIVEFSGEDTCTVTSREASGTFTYDRVFPINARQHEVFDYSIRSTVDDVLAGYNGTVFAYGQTGSGKTYTMMGADIGDDQAKGIIPRIVEQIFDSILRSDASIEFTVKVSYMEIYMEKIRDLLVPQNDNLPVHEDKSRGVYVKGLHEFYVANVGEVYQVLERGGQSRAVAATNMNQESSRSHSIFVIEVTQKNTESGSARSGRLFLVDLAGSEKVGKTGASGQTLEEAKKINKSLSALGMVINALSDGKSSHIPYRDSKLTRILQESLGGNSRTTLIINCSPSSYNDSETMSTLRFGERAKTIKQKAKINEELSPAQLKAQLKKVQSEVMHYQTYLSSLEGEVNTWRGGGQVPKEQWTPALKAIAGSMSQAPPQSATPSRLRSTQDIPGTPRPESRMEIERSGTPSILMDRDEKDDFLRRENEFQDQLAEKESALAAAEEALKVARNEIRDLRESHVNVTRSNEKLQGDVEGFRMQVEKIQFETKEASITMDSLKEANSELTAELDDVKHQLLDAKMTAKESSALLDEKDRLKKERMAQMMAGFDLGDGMMSANEMHVREMIQRVDNLTEIAENGDVIAPDELQSLKERLLEIQGVVRQADVGANGHEDDAHSAALEDQLARVQQDYQNILERNLSPSDVEEVKRRLQDSFASQQNGNAHSPDVQNALSRQQEENARLTDELETLRKQAINGGANGATLSKQLADFDMIKKSLMRDLQNRCERVVELEISLDSTREQYNSILRSSNSKQQQKKLAFLERNLEQLTLVQRQLVEQNAQLKKEVAIAERKLVARGERIRGLEGLVAESQEKLMVANHKFESQLLAVKERLEAAKSGSTRGLGQGSAQSPVASSNFANNPFGRIAKPLRGGGGGGGNDGPMVPTFSNMLSAHTQQQHGMGSPPQEHFGTANGAGKRGSWFFNQRT